MGCGNFLHAFALEGISGRERIIKNAAQRVNVRTDVGSLAQKLLRRREIDRSKYFRIRTLRRQLRPNGEIG